jgi:S1-C subfamily serine protease
VQFADGRSVIAEVIGTDADGDLAVLTADTGDAPALVWSDGSARPGAAVFGLAKPGGRGVRVTFGLITAADRAFRGPRGRRIEGSIEHTAPLARGSSGGPVVDAQGRLVGINTNRLDQGFYLAIPADDALRQRVDALGRGESVDRARLGVGLAPRRAARELRKAVGLEPRDGLLVREVVDDSPAARAGIKVGDLLVQAGDRILVSVDDLHAALDAASAGTAVNFVIVRGTDEMELAVTF